MTTPTENVVAEWRAAMEGVTSGPWKAVCRPDFSNGYTYTSVQPVEPNREKLSHLAMANGELHVCRMTHTPLERKFRLYERDAAWIARCSPSGISGLLALIESQRATIERVEREAAENASREFMWRDQLRAAEARVTALEAENKRITSDREFVIGFNAGWDEAVAQTLRFPTMLRKMWSGSEVQKWIDDAMATALSRSTEKNDD